MTSKNIFNRIGVIGAGSFGTVLANIAAENAEQVLVYVRSKERINKINTEKLNKGYKVKSNVIATDSIEEITSKCTILLAVVPSSNFRSMMKDFAPFLQPSHVIIHGTKGVDVRFDEGETLQSVSKVTRKQIHTMSEVITQESTVRRIGCLAGPNLSGEMADLQPAGAIVASKFNEVIRYGKQTLNTELFKIFSSNDILGAEFAGVLKNIFAIAAGILDGLGYGNNAKSLLITKGLHEMLYLGNSLGGETSAFLGIAGIGDLVATCSSPLSRNFSVGQRIAKNEKLEDILATSNEVAEGIRSIQIFYKYSKSEHLIVPFTETLFKVLFENKPSLEAVKELMSFKYSNDVNFL